MNHSTFKFLTLTVLVTKYVEDLLTSPKKVRTKILSECSHCTHRIQ